MDDAFTFTQRRDITLLLGVLISAIILVVPCLLPIFAIDQNTIAIPTTQYPINFDGNVVFDNEWKDAYKISFPGARSDGQNVTVYLKYGSNDRVLYGAFTIPGRSSVPPQSDSNEGIHFLFDVTGNANEYLDGSDHDIALYRDGIVQYSIGDKEQKTWIENATSSGALETELPLQDPLSKIDYRIIPAAVRWGGEFRIFFNPESELPKLYGFSLLAETDVITRTGEQMHKTMYYPPSSNRVNPSTWTKISFEGTPIINLRPSINGLSATITGEARPSEPDGKITNMNIDWGNGEEENFKDFPVSHTYSDPGRYNITVTVTDNNGSNAIKRIPLSVNSAVQPPPNEAPKIIFNPASPINKRAVSSEGTQVIYSANATDREDGKITPECHPASGTNFPIGRTIVTCTAKDSAGNETKASLEVNVNEVPWYEKPEYFVPIVIAIISSIIGPILVGRYGQKKRTRDRSNRKRR
jgi:PKD domain/HYR domain